MTWEQTEETCGDIHGKVGDVVYRCYPGIALQCVPYYIPTNPRSGKQQTWREIFAKGIQAWHALTEEEKAWWKEQAKKRGLVGQHYFQSVWLDARRLTGAPFTVGETVIGSDDYIIVGAPVTIGVWTIGSSEYVGHSVPIVIGAWTIGSSDYIPGP
jgi:hypothetical protein